jgi:hypothetical protein
MVAGSEYSLLGEVGTKLVPVSEYRFAQVLAPTLSRSGFLVAVRGTANEQVTVAVLVPGTGTGPVIQWRTAVVNATGIGLLQF